MDGALRWLYACRGESIGVGQTTSRSKIGFHLLTNLGNSMKKLTLVAGAVLGLVSATSAMAQSSVTLYGIVDAAVSYTSKQVGGSKTAIDAGQLATSRWGMRGTEDLGGGLKANFTLESTIANDTGAAPGAFGTPAQSSLFDRAAIVGVSGGFGAVTLGRQNILAVDAVGAVDPIGFSQPGINPNVAFSSLNNGLVTAYGTNGGQTALRQNNSIRYALPTMSGFNGAAMYGFGEQAGNSSANTYVGLVGSFNAGPITASLGYNQLKNASLTAATTDKLTLVGGGVKYAISDAFAVKATYTQSKADIAPQRKIAVAGVGVDFTVMPALTLTAAYYNTKRSGDFDSKANQLVGKVNYALSKRTSIYALMTNEKVNDGNQLVAQRVGLIATTLGENSANRIAIGVFHAF